jgi:hypothetical protein
MNWQFDDPSTLPPCPKCDGELYMVVQVQQGFAFDGPRNVPITLCPRCHADDPRSQALLAFFAFHSRIEAPDADEFAPLVEEWVRSRLESGGVNPATLDEDMRAHRWGEFD